MEGDRTRWLNISLVVYIALVLIGTLFPFQFGVPPYIADWFREEPTTDATDGLILDGKGMFRDVRTARNPSFGRAIRDAGRVTVELKLRPSNVDQDGPARIFAYSIDTLYQCLLVGQSRRDLVVRVPHQYSVPGQWSGQIVAFEEVFDAETWTRVVIHCDGDSIRLEQDGRPRGTRAVEFTPDSWAPCRLVVGNETTGNRPWSGRIRDLEVRTTETAGFEDPLLAIRAGEPLPPGWEPRTTDTRGRPTPSPWALVPFSEPPEAEWARVDWTLNIILLMPVGFLLALRGVAFWKIVLAAIFLSTLVETVQIFLSHRHTQTTDVVLNVLGAAMAALVARRAMGRGAPNEP